MVGHLSLYEESVQPDVVCHPHLGQQLYLSFQSNLHTILGAEGALEGAVNVDKRQLIFAFVCLSLSIGIPSG